MLRYLLVICLVVTPLVTPTVTLAQARPSKLQLERAARAKRAERAERAERAKRAERARRAEREREEAEREREEATPLIAPALAVAGTVTVLGLALSSGDEEISRRIVAHDSSFTRSVTTFGRSLGEIPLNFGALSLIGAYGWSQDDAVAKNCALDGFASAAIGEGLIVPALKISIGRARPNAGKGSHTYTPFSGDASFPSGHTAFAFSLAGTVNAWYPGWPGWTALALATTTAYSRVHTLSHWPSDTVAGAVIGYATATYVAHSSFRKRLPSFFPDFTRDYSGVTVNTRF